MFGSNSAADGGSYRKLEGGRVQDGPSIARVLLTRPPFALVKRAAIVFIFVALCTTFFISPYGPTTTPTEATTPEWKPPKLVLGSVGEHPIPGLMREADEKWQTIIDRQPKTYVEAYNAYQRRYGIRPPTGLLLWWEYARDNNVTLLDNFDELMESLAPFRKMGSAEMRRRVDIIMASPQDINAIWVHKNFHFYKASEEADYLTERTGGIMNIIQPVREIFNIVDGDPWMIPVNELAEPRVLKIEEEIHVDEAEFTDEKSLHGKIWESHSYGDDSLVQSVKKACGEASKFTKGNPDFKAVSADDEIPTSAAGSAFLRDVRKDKDICERPEIVKYHSSFRGRHWTTKQLYPMLGFGAPSIYGDIAFPSHFQYGEHKGYTFKDVADKPWGEKEDLLYWQGSPAGGGKGDKFFDSMHRHRVLKYFQKSSGEDALTGATAPPENKLKTTQAEIKFASQTNLTFVFPNKDGCLFFDCKHLETLPRSERASFDDTWSYKYLADLDGWGYSARSRAFFQSRSAVIKSTIFREWWNERIIPWKHYIPVSVSGKEWGDVLTYFLGHPEKKEILAPHDEDGHTIATEGRHWASKNMRRADMTAYSLRVFLELERLFNDNYLPGTNREDTWKAHKERWVKINAARAERKKKEKDEKEKKAASLKAEKEAKEAKEKADKAKEEAEKAEKEAKEKADKFKEEEERKAQLEKEKEDAAKEAESLAKLAGQDDKEKPTVEANEGEILKDDAKEAAQRLAEAANEEAKQKEKVEEAPKGTGAGEEDVQNPVDAGLTPAGLPVGDASAPSEKTAKVDEPATNPPVDAGAGAGEEDVQGPEKADPST